MRFLLLLLSFNAFALEVIKPQFDSKIVLRIVRAEPDSFETYTLMSDKGREMLLVCANNRVYDHNKKAFLEYRNFYNEIAGNFEIESNRACLEMGKFIESAGMGVSEERPFVLTLDKKDLSVDRIVYPKVDPYADEGDIKDLLQRPLIEKDHSSIKSEPW